MKLEGGIKELQGYDSLGWSWLLGVYSNVDGRGRALTKKWMEGVLSFATMDKLSRLATHSSMSWFDNDHPFFHWK